MLNIAHKMPFKIEDGRLHLELGMTPWVGFGPAYCGTNTVLCGCLKRQESSWTRNSMASIPTQARSKALRACLLCSLIQAPIDWKKNGCPNCESILEVSFFPCSPTGCSTASALVKESTWTHFDLYDHSVRRSCCHNWPWSELGWTVAANRFVFYWLCILKTFWLYFCSEICSWNVCRSCNGQITRGYRS